MEEGAINPQGAWGILREQIRKVVNHYNIFESGIIDNIIKYIDFSSEFKHNSVFNSKYLSNEHYELEEAEYWDDYDDDDDRYCNGYC